MKSKNNVWKIIVIVLVILCVGAGAFFLGKNSAEKAFQAERELNIRLNRAELENISLEDGPIYVIGHKSPASDTVCSAIAYASLLRELGYDAQAAVQGPVNQETAYILEKAGFEVPPLLEETAGKNIVLVDHSEYAQSADDLKDANIISIIDHHGVGICKQVHISGRSDRSADACFQKNFPSIHKKPLSFRILTLFFREELPLPDTSPHTSRTAYISHNQYARCCL